MEKARLTFATAFALVLLWAGAGEVAVASTAPAGPGSTAGSVAATGLKGLKPAQKKARDRELKRCRTVRVKVKRLRCVKRVKAKYRRIARRQMAKPRPVKPVAPTAIHEVWVTDNGCDVIQSSCFLPIRDGIRDTWAGRENPETSLEIKTGEAVRFVWDPDNRDSAHNVSLWSHPKGVSPFDFEMGGTATEGTTFQRTFTVPGVYQFRCSLHQKTQILNVTVTP